MLKTKCVASLDVIFNKVLGSNVIDDISGLGVLIDNDETSLVVISERRLNSDGKEGFSLDDTSNIGLDITAIKEESMWDVPLTIVDGSMLNLMYKALDEINESNLGVSINSELMPMNGLDSTDGSNLCIILDTELESIDGVDGSTLCVILSNGLSAFVTDATSKLAVIPKATEEESSLYIVTNGTLDFDLGGVYWFDFDWDTELRSLNDAVSTGICDSDDIAK